MGGEQAASPDPAAAADLHRRVVVLARRHDHRRLWEIAVHPQTPRLLEMLSAETRARTRLHLDAGTRWADRQRQANRRRMGEAVRALNDLDVSLARGLTMRVEKEFLDDRDRRTLVSLLSRIDGLAGEMEEITRAVSDVVDPPSGVRRSRWWRRR